MTTMTHGHKVVVKMSDASESIVDYSSISGSMSFQGCKLADWIAKHGTIHQTSISIDKDGNLGK